MENNSPSDEATIATGTCLCRSIAYEVRLPFESFVNCHCSRCRKASGSAYAANALVAPEAFRWTRGEHDVVRYDLPEARSFAVSFCRLCGSQLPHLTRSGTMMIVPAGTLDDDPGVKPSMHVHWRSRAPWFPPPGDLPTSD